MHIPSKNISWDKIHGKPDFDALYAALNHNHDDRYAFLNHNHDDRYYLKNETYTQAEVQNLISTTTNNVDLSNYYDKAEVDSLLLAKAPASHDHSNSYVTASTLNSLLADKVDYNSLSLTLQGFESTDSNIIRFVSQTQDWITLRYYSQGQNVDFDIPTRSVIEEIQVTLAVHSLF